MSTDNPMPTDHVDTVRVQLDKLAKLAPELDSWVYTQGCEHPEQDVTEAARATVSGAFQLRKALFDLEHLAQEIVESRDQQQADRMTKFFGPDTAEGE